MKLEKGQIALITGAGGGLGRCLALALAHQGLNLALVDINPDSLEETAALVAATGSKVSQHAVDIRLEQQMLELRDQVLAQHGGLNILINNAGITLQKSFVTHSIADWQRMIDINLWGPIYGCTFFLPALSEAAKNGGAHIVNLSSMSAFVGLPGQSSYCATKAGVHLLSESLWSELYDSGIGVTSVHPGAIKTDMIKATLEESDDVEKARQNFEFAQRTGVTPEHAAERIIDAISKNRIRIRIGKDAVLVDLLKRLLPKTILRPMIKVFRDSQS